MSRRGGKNESIRRFLLGDISEQEREEVERRLMSDDDLFRQLLIAEDELIDEYTSGSLTEREREKFGRHFLHVPGLRQDVRFAAALKKHAVESAPHVAAETPRAAARASPLDALRKLFMRPALGASLAAALLAAVLLVTWLVQQNSQLRRQVEHLQARQTPPPSHQGDLEELLASERLRNEQLAAELRRQQGLREDAERARESGGRPRPAHTPKPPVPRGGVTLASITLTPGIVRDSGELKQFSVPPGARAVPFQLDLPKASYRSFSVVLGTVEGRRLWSRQGLRAGGGGKHVFVTVPANHLSPNDYQILLSGVLPSGETEEIGSYYFRVLK